MIRMVPSAYDKVTNVRCFLFAVTGLKSAKSLLILVNCMNARSLSTSRMNLKLDAVGSSPLFSKNRDRKSLLCCSDFQSHFVSLNSRKIWTTVPVQMGRRSSKIAIRKGAQDAKKAKLYGRIGKEIVSAVRRGGSPNPVANPMLATLLQNAKDFDIPKDIIERNIKKASEKGQQDFEPIIYEAYGFGGIGILIEVLTDNSNRAAANVRDVVKKSQCKMADIGSVQFNFKKAGVINIKADKKVDGDSLLATAMDAGAEDVIEPTYDEDEDTHDYLDRYYKVITPLEQYAAVSIKLREAGIPLDLESSGLEYIPNAILMPDDEAIELNKALMEKLLELDDVDAVYSNQP